MSHPEGIGEEPKPGRSGATTRWRRARWGMFSSQFCQQPPRPWIRTMARCVLGLDRTHLGVVDALAVDVDIVEQLAPVDRQPIGVRVAVGIGTVGLGRVRPRPERLEARQARRPGGESATG